MKNEDVNKEINGLKLIKDLLSIYHSKLVKNYKKIDILINSLEKNCLNEIYNKLSLINEIKEKFKDKVDTIKKVKDSLLFNMIYDKNKLKSDNEEEIFGASK